MPVADVRALFTKYPRVVQFQLEPFRAILWFATNVEMPDDPALWESAAYEVPQLPVSALRDDATELSWRLLADPDVVKPQVWHRVAVMNPEPEPEPAPVVPTVGLDVLLGSN